MFRELLRHTTPEEAERYNTLITTSKKIEEVTQQINEGTRDFEKKQRLVDIQNAIEGTLSEDLVNASRQLIKEGAMKSSEGEGKEYRDSYVFLFNDLFLITKPKKGDRYQLRAEVSLRDTRIVDIAPSESKF